VGKLAREEGRHLADERETFAATESGTKDWQELQQSDKSGQVLKKEKGHKKDKACRTQGHQGVGGQKKNSNKESSKIFPKGKNWLKILAFARKDNLW